MIFITVCLCGIQVSTFQAVILTDGVQSYAMLHYANITWTTGAACYGDSNGLGGYEAAVCLCHIVIKCAECHLGYCRFQLCGAVVEGYEYKLTYCCIIKSMSIILITQQLKRVAYRYHVHYTICYIYFP